MRLMRVVGARPQIIKSVPIIRETMEHDEIQLQLIHTGQHYDFEMSKIFFDEMTLPEPLANLGVGSGTHAWQTGNMMIELEKTMTKYKPDLVMVPGDTNSTLAGALVFFTTDMDARYLHPDELEWTRNLVIASSFGLRLHPDLQKNTPPFRDTYQTALFFATRLAMTRAMEGPEISECLATWLRAPCFSRSAARMRSI